MSAIHFYMPSRVFDANGAIAPGAKAFFYVPGGTTPRTPYADEALTTPHTNPVVADGGGKFPSIYLDNDLEYRVVVKSSDESETYLDEDPYNPSAATTFVNVTIDTAAPNTIKINGNTLAASAGTATLTFPNTTTTIVGRNTTDTLTNKTLTSAILNTPTINNATLGGTPIEDVHTVTDSAGVELDPANGSIQMWTLTANRTPKGTNFQNGQAILLGIDDGTAYTVTWTDATFGGSGVKWLGGAAPTLATSGRTWVSLWKVAGQVYGSLNGSST